MPRHAIYDNQWVYVFIADDEAAQSPTGRLERRRVPMLRSVRDEVLVDFHGREQTEPCELLPGDRVVVSPLTKPVVGMRIRLRDDTLTARSKNLGPPSFLSQDLGSVPQLLGTLASADPNAGGR